MFINYAHRGACAYAPENTLMSFYMGIWQRANGIETDVQITKDGALVLFHDDTLLRVTGEAGCIGDYTYDQLREFSVKNGEHTDRIVSLEDFLQHFSHRPLRFAIELKLPFLEKQVIDLLNRYDLRPKTVLTSFDFDNLLRAKAYDSAYEIGYLITDVTSEMVEKLLQAGGEEICPRADRLTRDLVADLHGKGLRVRAWGVRDEAVMEHAVRCGCDGMTVNFPDKLHSFLQMSKTKSV